MQPMNISRILVVEDDANMCRSILELLEWHGYAAHTANRLADALDAVEDVAYDLVLLDLKLAEETGFAVMDRLAERKLDTRIIVITGCHSEDFAITALKKGAIDYLKKPFEPDDLMQSVNTVLTSQRHLRELRLFEEIVAASPEAILIADMSGRIIFTNTAYRQLLAPIAAEPGRPAVRRHSENDAACFDAQIQKAIESGKSWSGQVDMIDTAGHRFIAWKRVEPLPRTVGDKPYGIAMMHAMAARPNADDLEGSLNQIKDLFGMLSICASCKKIRNDDGGWSDIETFIESRTNVEFSHGICPDCVRDLYPELRHE